MIAEGMHWTSFTSQKNDNKKQEENNCLSKIERERIIGI